MYEELERNIVRQRGKQRSGRKPMSPETMRAFSLALNKNIAADFKKMPKKVFAANGPLHIARKRAQQMLLARVRLNLMYGRKKGGVAV